MPLSAISCRQAGPGDNPPVIMNDWGQKPCRNRPANTPISCNRTGLQKGNGVTGLADRVSLKREHITGNHHTSA